MKLTVDTKKIEKNFENLARQLPYITMLALNDTAFDAQSSLKSTVKGKLKIKKQSVIGAFRVIKAKKTKLVAQVFVDEFSWQHKALAHHFEGGDRERKGMEKALQYMGAMNRSQILTPSGGIKISPSVYVKMMSQLKLNYKAGYSANQTTRSSKRKRVDKTKYFIATKRDKRTRHLSEGIYARIPGYNYPLSILTISDKPQYTKRFDVNKITQKVVDRRFSVHFSKAIEKAMRTSR